MGNLPDDVPLEAHSSFVEEVDRIWSEVISAFGWPTVKSPLWGFDRGKVTLEVADDPHRVNAAIHRLAEDQLWRSEICQNFLARVKQLLADKNLSLSLGPRNMDDHDLLYYLVSCSYPHRRGKSIEGRSINKTESSFAEMMGDVTADDYSVTVVAPLVNFESFATDLDVTSHISIRSLSDDDKAQLVGRFASHGPFPGTGFDLSTLARCDWALQLSSSFARGNKVEYDRLILEVTRALTCLRLLKPGRVGALAAMVLSPAAGHSIHDPAEIAVSPGGSKFSLLQSEHEPLRNLGRALELPESHSLEFALRWFNQAAGARWSQDIIIAAAIALEGALMPNVREEISFRLGLRGAALMAEDFDPEETFRTFRILYSARSSIVHEGRPLAELPKGIRRKLSELDGEPAPQALPEIALTTARRALRSLVLKLRSGVGRSELLDELERQAITGLRGGRP